MAEVESPVTRKGSKVGSGQPLGPGARSNPSRATDPRPDSLSSQPARTSRHAELPLPTSTATVIGSEE
jgi:hypothetical protein